MADPAPWRGETILRLSDGVALPPPSSWGQGGHVAQAPRQMSSSQRLDELRRAHRYDATLQNLLTLLTAKLDLSARLPVFEYEADSEGFPEVASFISALASAERESVQDVVRSLRLHLDSTGGRFTSPHPSPSPPPPRPPPAAPPPTPRPPPR